MSKNIIMFPPNIASGKFYLTDTVELLKTGEVFSEKARRTKRKLTLTGSMFMVSPLSFVIGFNVSKVKFESSSWGADYLSSVTDSIYPYSIPQDVDEFISYSFNGQ